MYFFPRCRLACFLSAAIVIECFGCAAGITLHQKEGDWSALSEDRGNAATRNASNGERRGGAGPGERGSRMVNENHESFAD